MISFKRYVLESSLENLERKTNLSPQQKADLHILLTVAREDDGQFKADYQNRLIKEYGILLTDSPEYATLSKMVPDAKKKSSSELKNEFDIKIEPTLGGILYVFRESQRNPRTIILVHSAQKSLVFIKEISFDEEKSTTVHEEEIWIPGQNDETKINRLIRHLS